MDDVQETPRSRKAERQSLEDRIIAAAMSKLQITFRDWLDRPAGWWLSSGLMEAEIRDAIMPMITNKIEMEVEVQRKTIQQLRQTVKRKAQVSRELHQRLTEMLAKTRSLRINERQRKARKDAAQKKLQKKSGIDAQPVA